MKTKNNKAISTLIAVTIAVSILVAFSATASATDHNVPVQYPTIQDAINAAANGDTIIVADGTYTITAAINVNKGVTITGNVANPENVLVKYSSAVTDKNCFDITVNNVMVQGIKAINGKRGFYLNGVTGCKVSNCIVSSCADKGIYVRNCPATSEATRVEVTGNIVSDCGNTWGSACIQTYVSPYTYIYNNIISSTNDKGINILQSGATETAERIQVVGNTISGCGYPAIQTYGGKYTYIYDNTISSTNDKGINIIKSGATGTADRIQVIGNTIFETKWPGIQVIGSPYTYVYSNTLTKCNYYGDITGDWDYASIHVQDDGTVSGANVIIDSNTVSDGINGIQTWSDNCEITNNSIYDMGLTYANTKTTADGTYYNSGIIIGSNWLTYNIKPTGTTVTCNSIHDNYWGLYVRDYATLSRGDPSVLSVTAECNWWGDDSGPTHLSNPLGTGDNVSDSVDFAPWIGITDLSGPADPVQLGDSVNIDLSFTCNMGTATLDWGDGTPVISYSSESETTTELHTYSEPGVYMVTLTIEDCCGRSYSREFRYVVVYDPAGGFVTGGGWINSPVGAYSAQPTLTGKANFGFVSKYKKGQSTLTGNTEFQFKAGDLNFHSDSYEWLVIAGHKAMYKGTGTINGDGNFGFMLSAIDEKLSNAHDVDMFRIKIWDKDDGDAVVYDNNIGNDDDDDADPATEIAGGQIVIHKAK